MATVKKLFRMQNKKLPALIIAILLFWCATAVAQKSSISLQLDKCITKAIKNPFGTLAEEELALLTPDDLSLFNNFIYTRRYTELRSPRLAGYFATSDKLLTATIKQDSRFIRSTAYNLELLQAFHNKDSITLNQKEQFDSIMAGYWQEGTSVIAAALLTNYHFLQADHSFLYEQKTAGAAPLLNYSGFYSTTAAGMELEIRTKTIFKIQHINRAKNTGGKTAGSTGRANEKVIHYEEAYEYKSIRISPVYRILFDGISKHYCRINGKIFWKCYPAE